MPVMNIFTITLNNHLAMAYDLEQQEQIASLKEWWNKYGNLLTWVLIVGLSAYAAWTGWSLYQGNQSTKASQLYEEVQKAVSAKDAARVQRAASDMEEKFGRTAYAGMTALTAAKVAFDAGNLKEAAAHLQWAAEHGRDAEYKAIAKIRLAGISLDTKAYDEGLKALSGSFPAAFEGAVADRRGDILVAQNKREEARAAYQLALKSMDQKNPGRQLVQLKLDALGGVPAKPAA